MRLINTQTRQLEEFWDEKELKYAILSHVWETGEVSFQELHSPAAKKKKGYAKIELSCLQAIRDGLEYVWVDTCCINKESSAELSEAINSMYRWYKHSTVCYAFVADVQLDRLHSKEPGSLSTSAWFTRGWTLQELIAPKSVVFYDSAWEFLGTKQSLGPTITQVTGIDAEILNGESIFDRSVAQRMSWASNRVTTRDEDIAYCLLGIFDVNMPMLYGEGPKAFARLQEEIIRQSDDHSIFAWAPEGDDEPGLLARSPKAFATSKYVRSTASRHGRSAFSMTNRGLSVKLDVVSWCVDTYLVRLHCVDELMHTSSRPIEDFCMGMFLRRLDEDDQYARVHYEYESLVHVTESTWEAASPRKPLQARSIHVNIRQHLRPGRVDSRKERINGYRLTSPELLEFDKIGNQLFKIHIATWDPEQCIMSVSPGRPGTVALVDISLQNRKIKAIKLGFDFDYSPICFVAYSGGLSEKIHALDRTGNLNWGGGEWQYTAEERLEFQSIHQRSCYDEGGWSIIQNGKASQLEQHSGLWALKGDRLHGLSVQLSDFDGSLTTLEIKRGDLGGRMVWDVHVGGLKGTFWRKLGPTPVAAVPTAVQKKDAETVSDEKSDAGNGTSRKKSGFNIFKGK